MGSKLKSHGLCSSLKQIHSTMMWRFVWIPSIHKTFIIIGLPGQCDGAALCLCGLS